MFGSKKQQTSKEVRRVAFRCKCCDKIVAIDKEQIKLRERGYKGCYQAHVTCPRCNKDSVISDEFITKEVRRYLDELWMTR